ncbi:MAG: DNA-directed RNA polymerase subunit B, partial [Candidatus Aenigmarchaeota archaeon]|nr:DNA-directed RNA polymerase subunit B [Candidatus Aenigmarchaeota archaeon]
YFNGKFVGTTPKGEKFVEDVRKKRRANLLSSKMNVVYYKEFDEIRINTDSGRLRRPLIIVEKGKSKLTEEHLKKVETGELKWNDLITKGILEFIDAEEEENAYIALTEKDVNEEHTHVEISPSIILGISASLIPFAEHNRGDRVNYGAKMTGQAIGMYASNFLMRTDTKANLMIYPQIPLVRTESSDIVGLTTHPAGQNLVIAVMPYGGYNMEDALVINRGSVDRGMLRSVYFRIYETDEKKYWGGQEDEIRTPDPTVRGYKSEDDYKRLGEDGIINLENAVTSGDVLIGKISPLRFLGTVEEFMTGIENRRESSVTVRHGEKGIVDKIVISESADGNRLIKVSVRDERIIEIGDKVSSRHGQKGVIGLLVNPEDMPFTESGVIPDILFNTHSIPSRMTMGQLLEMITGKTSSITGEYFDSTGFTGVDENYIRETLGKLGFREDGKETLYDGKTGKQYDVMIYTGVAYYQKLDHMVANKIHARSRGPVALLTKQPTEGRAKEGGLRLGEMEKDCIIAHGAAMVLKERFDSDKYMVAVCENCGLIAMNDRTKNKLVCSLCSESKISWVEMSYAFKLMLEELKSLLIYPRVDVGEHKNPG